MAQKTTNQIAREIAGIMPKVGRWILFEFFQSIEMPSAQIFAIMTVAEHGRCTFGELSGLLKVSAPTVTGIVDRLEKSGHTRRVRSREDRRVIHVELTVKGEKVAKQLRGVIEEKWVSIVSDLPKSDAENYLRILKKIQVQIQGDQ